MTHYRVVKWETYQHYTNRRPPWLKLYTTFNEDSQQYSTPTRLILALFLCVAAKKDNRIPADVRWLSVEMGVPEKEITAAVKDLLGADFIAVYDEQNSVIDDKDASKIASKSASDSAMPTRVSSSSGSSSLAVSSSKAEDARETEPAARNNQREGFSGVWEAVSVKCGRPTKGMESRRAKVVHALLDEGARAADVYERHPLIEQRWPEITVTDTTLVKHWHIALMPLPKVIQKESWAEATQRKNRESTAGAWKLLGIDPETLNGHHSDMELQALEEAL